MAATLSENGIRRACYRNGFADSRYLYFGSDNDCSLSFDGNKLILNRDAMTSGDSSMAFQIDAEATSTTAGIRQGAMSISLERTSSYPLASWDGNPDCGLKMAITNRAANASGGAVRGLDINARNRDATGAVTWINGAYITAENSSGSGGLTNVTGAEVHAKNNGVASGDVICLKVYDESQSYTGTSYAIHIDCTNNSPFAREFCIYINSGAASSWTNGITFDGNITNTFDFADTDGTNGATYSSGHYSSLGNVDGKIQVDIGGNTLYIPCYASIAA